jgi:hypothetical protein
MDTKFESVQHPFSAGHRLLKVTHRGRVYACVSANDTPEETTPRMVQYLWNKHRQDFLPYNEATGTFCLTTKLRARM